MTFSTTDNGNPLDGLVEEFLDRQRRGEHPALSEYVARYPDLAGEIRDLFPVLAMVERFKPVPGELAGPPSAAEREDLGDARGRLGDYRIIRSIGGGGMGMVYEAERQSLKCRVALKVMHAEYRSSGSYLRRFHTEARSAARLHHTNIVGVFDYGAQDGICYYAMQYIAGHGLDVVLDDVRRLRGTKAGAAFNEPSTADEVPADRSRQSVTLGLLTGRYAADPSPGAPDTAAVTVGTGIEGAGAPGNRAGPEPLLDGGARRSKTGRHAEATIGDSSSSLLIGTTEERYHREVARIGAQVADALEYAHCRGVLHRDIKPSNLLLDAMGNVWVTDFGLAKFDEGDDLSRSQDLVGTLRYMAPERFRGVSKRGCDVYALGATLYELLTLRPAFEGQDQLRLVERIAHETPVPPRRLDPRIARDLETVVLKAMAKEPGDRFGTAREMAEELRRFLENQPLRSRPVPVYDRLWRWGMRNPLVAGLAGGLVLAMVLGTVASTAFAIRASGNAAEAREQAGRADVEARRARDEKLISDRQLYMAEIQLAQQAWQDGRPDMVENHLRMLEPKRAGDPDLRGSEWYYLDRLCRSPGLHTLRGHTYLVRGVAFSPDGRTVASGGGDSMVKLWNAADGREIRTLPGHTDELYAVAFSPDGRSLASASADRTVRLWETATGREIRTLGVDADKVRCVAFSPDGRLVAWAGHAGTVTIWDAASGQEVRKLPGREIIYAVAFSPDSASLASASHDHTVILWDAVTGQKVRTLKGHVDIVRGVAFSPDGRFLASSSYDHTVILWDATTGREIRTLRGHTQIVGGVAFSPDGRLVVSCGDDHTLRLWDPATGEGLRVLRGHSEQVYGVAFSPDGRFLASASYDQTLTIWDVFASQEARSLRGHTDVVIHAAYSPDGRFIVSAGHDKIIRLWDVAAGQTIRSLIGHTDRVLTVTYSPDGRSIASAGDDRTVRIWEAASGKEVRTLQGHGEPVYSVAYSPDGRNLASASGDYTVRIWEAASGKEAMPLRGHTARVVGVAYSPDGRTLASGGYDFTVRLWDVATWQTIRTLHAHKLENRPLPTFTALAFSADGRRIAAACVNRTVSVWDAATGREILTLRGHSESVIGLAFSPDGQRLASSSNDHTAKIWDAVTGQEVLTLRGHRNGVTSIAWRPDGHQIVTSSADQTVKIWDAGPLTPWPR